MFLLYTFLISITVITLVHSCKCNSYIPIKGQICTHCPHSPEFPRSRHCEFDGRTSRCDNSNSMNFTCKTPDQLDGTCTPISDCKYMVDLLKSQDLSNTDTMEFILGHKCDNVENANVGVCCPKHNVDIGDFLPNTDQCGIADPLPLCRCTDCSCEIPDSTLALGECPWMALLYFRKSNNDVYPGCAGSLISKNYVLTAAHCLDKHIWRTHNINKIDHVVLGDYNTDTNPDCSDGDCADPVQKLLVENFYIHHQWKRHTYQNDIALIKLKETVSYTRFIKPVCLPKSGSNIEELPKEVIIAGWGKTESGQRNPIVTRAKLPIENRTMCSFSGRELSSKQFCIGVSSKVSDCQGNSGGPVMYRDHDSGGVVHLIGIVSYGRICGTYPRIYTYVTPYLAWIHEIMFFY